MATENNSHKASHELTGSNKAAKIGAVTMLLMFIAILFFEVHNS